MAHFLKNNYTPPNLTSGDLNLPPGRGLTNSMQLEYATEQHKFSEIIGGFPRESPIV